VPGRVFLDSNVLVYAIESAGPEAAKSSRALALARRTDVCLSVQVLGEFYRAVTSPRRAGQDYGGVRVEDPFRD
jgi:predicted nucleic acid-binding protein